MKRALLLVPALAGIGALMIISNRDGASSGPPSAAAQAVVAAAGSGSLSDDQKKAVEGLIKDYLTKPENWNEIQTILEERVEQLQSEKLKVLISENAKEIFRSENPPFAGNPDGDITVVEFFDYNCGYCKRGLEGVVKLIETDPKVRVVFKELPILSKGSEEAARSALAARNQGKYWEMHRGLLENKGQNNEASALAIAGKIGLDVEKLKADMNSDAIKAELQKDLALAKRMGINGTPHFLVGNRSIPGAPEDLHDQLTGLVGELRKTGCAYC